MSTNSHPPFNRRCHPVITFSLSFFSSVEFQAAGRTILPPPTSQQEQQVIEIQGTLTKPISLTPVPPPVPLGINTRDCLKKSKNPQWTISNFKQWQTRQFLVNILWSFAVRIGDLHFDVHNVANNVTVPCRLRNTHLTNYTDSVANEYSDFSTWWSCDPPKDHQSFPKYSLSTAVQLNKQKLTLGVRQTWYCTDEGDTRPYGFSLFFSLPTASSYLFSFKNNALIH